MKDLIAKLKSEANVALGAIWLHIDAQAARIAELEAQIAAKPAGTDKLWEAISDEQIMRIAGDVKQRNARVWPGDVAFARAVLASTALQAPVREVPEVIGAIANAPVVEPIPVGISFSERHCDFYRADTGQGMGNEFYDKWRDRADEFPDRITARAAIKAAPLPAAPVQEPKP